MPSKSALAVGIIHPQSFAEQITSAEICVRTTNTNIPEKPSVNDLLEVMYKLINYIIAQNRAKNKGIFIIKFLIYFRYEALKKNKLRCMYLYSEVYFSQSNKVDEVNSGFN